MDIPDDLESTRQDSVNGGENFTWRRSIMVVFIFIFGVVVSGIFAYFIAPIISVVYQLSLLLAMQSVFMVTAFLLYSRGVNALVLSWRFARRDWAIGTVLVVDLCFH